MIVSPVEVSAIEDDVSAVKGSVCNESSLSEVNTIREKVWKLESRGLVYIYIYIYTYAYVYRRLSPHAQRSRQDDRPAELEDEGGVETHQNAPQED